MDRINVKTAEFGEITQNDNGVFQLTDAQLYSEFEKRGLENAKEVLKTVTKTKQAFAQDVYGFLGKKVKETKADAFLTAGTGDNRIEYGVLATKEVTIPGKQGETPRTEVRYGYCTYKEQHRIPDAWKKEDGVLAKMAEEIEAALK